MISLVNWFHNIIYFLLLFMVRNSKVRDVGGRSAERGRNEEQKIVPALNTTKTHTVT